MLRGYTIRELMKLMQAYAGMRVTQRQAVWVWQSLSPRLTPELRSHIAFLWQEALKSQDLGAFEDEMDCMMMDVVVADRAEEAL